MDTAQATSHLADLIRAAMRAREMSQAEAARACGMSESQLSSLLKRPRTDWPKTETVLKLKRLGIPPAETMDAVSRDLGLGPLLRDTVPVSDDPELQATVRVLSQLDDRDVRRVRRIARTLLEPDEDNGDDGKS